MARSVLKRLRKTNLELPPLVPPGGRVGLPPGGRLRRAEPRAQVCHDARPQPVVPRARGLAHGRPGGGGTAAAVVVVVVPVGAEAGGAADGAGLAGGGEVPAGGGASGGGGWKLSRATFVFC